VLAFAAEHYDHWTQVFGIERDRWDWCHWGENLTIAGLDENVLRVGDLLETEGGVRFEVTSPRIPCFKLAWRIGQPDSCLAQITGTGRVGVYLRVIAPGVVGPGERIARVSENAEAITVGDLSRALTDLTLTDVGRLREIAALPALGGQARGMLRKRIAAIEDADGAAQGRWTGWRPFKVVEVVDEAAGVKSFRLAPEDGQPAPRPRAGQFLTVQLPHPSGAGTVRTWSLSDHGEDAPWRLTVRRQEGPGSTFMHEAAAVGTTLLARPPAGRFALDRSGFLRVVLISAGSGVTPLLAMLKAHAARGDEVPPLVWVHAAQNGAGHVLKDEADAVLSTHGFERHVFYTRPAPDDVQGRDYDHAGRPTPETLQDLLGGAYVLNPFGRDIELTGRDAEFYICGPAPFEAMVREALAGMGVPAALIRSETFATGLRAGGEATVTRAQVEFRASGVTASWSAEDDLTLLDLAEAHGLTPAFSCRAGACQTCQAPLAGGEIAYDPLPLCDAAAGQVLICCARPASDTVVLDL
jgi:ferredoxin-NADP reductase/MOSC domain-containing protein YiiM